MLYCGSTLPLLVRKIIMRFISLLYIFFVTLNAIGVAALFYLNAFNPMMLIVSAIIGAFLVGRMMVVANT